MSTVALSMIVKDEYFEVEKMVALADGVFDEINLVVSDKTTANKLGKLRPVTPFHVKYREWNDCFDEARNVALEMCTTDYMFWLDADDLFSFSSIPRLVQAADQGNFDAIFLPYNYMRDEAGNIITRHYRERLVRLGRGYSWRGWVHETLISDEDVRTVKFDSPVVEHTATVDDAKGSYERNHLILAKAYEATEDPRYLHYLGMSFFTGKEYEKAATLMSEYLEVGGSIEDVYRTLGLLSECAYHLGQFDLALEYATKQATLKPEYPMAYWLLAQYEADQENYEEALEWVKVSETKPDPNTLSVWDPSSRKRATMIAARCLFMLGRYNEALAQAKKIADMPEMQDVIDDFYQQADAETFVSLLPKMRKFFRDDKVLYDALCHDMQYDKRLQSLRFHVNKPQTWKNNSVVIFCGQGYEEWGPHTLDKGMGGSEEAVVYLSREMARLGYDVTVFGEAEVEDIVLSDEKQIEGRVHYRHWKEIDTRDQFNIFISWRAPQYIEKINAKVKLVDLHDVIPAEIVKDYPGVTYMVKSQYHRDLYPHLPDEKFVIIGNGIKKEQFK